MKTKSQKSDIEQEELENEKQFELSEKESAAHASAEPIVNAVKENKKPSKAKRIVVSTGFTDEKGNFLPADKEGNISDAYKDRIKKMKPYTKYSDGSVEIG